MIKNINIFGYRINFVFRHRFEKKDEYLLLSEFRDYKLGVWFKKYKAVGKPKNGPAIIGKDGTLTNCYMLGFDLIFCKFWIDVSHRPLTLKID
jgi:hypothetical protein